MQNTTTRKVTGLLLIAVPVVFNLFFTLLQINFEYPTILRKPADYVLRQFQAGGAGLIANWYGMVISALLFIPLAILVHKTLKLSSTLLALATVSGVVAGIVQFLGLIRWPFLVPTLAETYLNPATTSTTREATAVVFQAFNTYAGVAVGENMGYFFTGAWTILISLVILQTGLTKSWLGWGGIVAGLAIVSGMLEPAGLELAGTINLVGYLLWSLWLVALGIIFLTGKIEMPTFAENSPKIGEKTLAVN